MVLKDGIECKLCEYGYFENKNGICTICPKKFEYCVSEKSGMCKGDFRNYDVKNDRCYC